MGDIEIAQGDEIVMKLLYYFITQKGYNPIILHGAQNEIWLENLNEDYRIVRIVSNYIHNDEQLDFDLYRTKKIIGRIKKQTFSFGMNAISFYVNLGDSVHLEEKQLKNILCFSITSMKDFKKKEFEKLGFQDLVDQTDFKEKGFELFMKITGEINEKNADAERKAARLFEPKKPYVTYFLIAINILLFLAMYYFGEGSEDSNTLISFGANYAPLVRNGEYYRLLTSAFLHIGLVHIVMNMYALFVIGSQIESFYGKWKYLIIYLGSAITGSMMSMLFSADAISAGASGAIFGLLGALFYFGYHYRVYLGNVLRSQIIPMIVLNILMGFLFVGIDNAAHIGGLVGGILLASFVGVPYKSTTSDKINGLIMTIIYVSFLIYMAFFR